MSKIKLITYSLFIFSLLISCKDDDGDLEPVPFQTTPLEVTIPSNFPPMTYPISQNPPTEEGFELGRRLFYEGRLSSDNVISCGFCHIQQFAFTHNDHFVSHGADGAVGTRNAPPVQNMAFMNDFNVDGAAATLDMQPIIPITGSAEMNTSFTEIIAKLSDHPEYPTLFAKAFENGEINSENILRALSQFQVMMVSAESKYDKVLRGEGNVTLTAIENQGRDIYDNKCASCHSGVLLTDQSYRSNGLPVDPQYNDIGRERVTGLTSDRYKFKVSSLKNIEFTGPYMHDGRFWTLEDVLDHYSDGMVNEGGTLDPQFIQNDGSLGIPLTADDKTALIAFMRTLSDTDFIFDSRFSEF
ncbi:MAG: cytochrome-c peroxidase [Flavobacteriaceae bacterium]|nr:cytochrome-c peroxidase [Flavobacteriaceae bacterium]